MNATRQHMRMTILAAVTLVVLVVVVVWSRRAEEKGFATPAECLDAYCNASKDGDAERYLSCLAQPLRSEVRQRHADMNQLANYLRLNTADVRNWAQHPQTGNDESTAVIDLEETRDSSARWTRIRVEKTGKGWLIVSIGQPEERPLNYRPGRPVDEGREGSGPRTEP